VSTEADLIAPCGMNCAICMGYLREKNRCPGCHGSDSALPGYCSKCVIRNCDQIRANQSGFCYECPRYPCRRLRELDKRYRTRYAMSMLENLDYIRMHGVTAFVEIENRRWRCDRCGGVVCVHRGYCFQCGQKPD
jgi:hypothetical protein